MNIREYLNQSFVLGRSIDAKKEVLKTLDMSISLTTDSLLLRSLKCEKEKIEAEINKELEIRMNIFDIIEKVEDITLKSLLQYKYICGMSTEDIAEKLNFTPRHIFRMNIKAVEEAEKHYKIA